MRVAIQPKLARRSSDDFWREVQRLCLFKPEDRKAALQKWFPEPVQRISSEDAVADRRDAIKRFSFIFDRNFGAKNSNAPKEKKKSPDESELPADCAIKAKARCEDEDHARASGDLESMSQQAGAGAAVQVDGAPKGEKSSKKRERK